MKPTCRRRRPRSCRALRHAGAHRGPHAVPVAAADGRSDAPADAFAFYDPESAASLPDYLGPLPIASELSPAPTQQPTAEQIPTPTADPTPTPP